MYSTSVYIYGERGREREIVDDAGLSPTVAWNRIIL